MLMSFSQIKLRHKAKNTYFIKSLLCIPLAFFVTLFSSQHANASGACTKVMTCVIDAVGGATGGMDAQGQLSNFCEKCNSQAQLLEQAQNVLEGTACEGAGEILGLLLGNDVGVSEGVALNYSSIADGCSKISGNTVSGFAEGICGSGDVDQIAQSLIQKNCQHKDVEGDFQCGSSVLAAGGIAVGDYIYKAGETVGKTFKKAGETVGKTGTKTLHETEQTTEEAYHGAKSFFDGL